MKTDKRIEDVIHLYIGCEVFGTYNDASGSKGILTGVTNGGHECEIQFFLEDGINVEEEPEWNETKEIKLILRPLNSMTEEERAELWSVVFNGAHWRKFTGSTRWIPEQSLSSDPRWILMQGVERLAIEMNGTVWADSDLHSYKHNQHEVTRWFLSKGFDLFSLIPSGLAIDKTTLK